MQSKHICYYRALARWVMCASKAQGNVNVFMLLFDSISSRNRVLGKNNCILLPRSNL